MGIDPLSAHCTIRLLDIATEHSDSTRERYNCLTLGSTSVNALNINLGDV